MRVNTLVLDSFAILAFLRGEPGGDSVKTWLQRAEAGRVRLALSTINLGEVLYIVERRHGLTRAAQVLAFLQAGPLVLYEATLPRVLAAAHLKARFPIALADAFAAALAQELKAPLLTGDPEFKALEGTLTIHWLTEDAS